MGKTLTKPGLAQHAFTRSNSSVLLADISTIAPSAEKA